MSYGRMKQVEERLEREIEELMQQAEAVDNEEDKLFGKDNNGYNVPEELQRREERLNKIRGLREELEREKREEQGLGDGDTPLIKDKEQRSFADRKARMMLMKRGEFDYGYNAQVCTEESHGIILAADLTNNPADTEHLPQIVEEVRELRQELGYSSEDKQTQMSADSGYLSADNIKTEGDGIELLIASGRERKEGEKDARKDNRVYSLKRFYYDKEEDVWRCPEGRLLRQEAIQADGRYRYVCQDCAGCRLMPHCLKPGENRRTLIMEENQLLLGEMRARMKKPEKHEVYRKRKWVAEQPIGQIKDGMGFREVTMRGDDYARGQWRLVCAVHNVMKAVRFITGLRKSAKMEALLA
jgi:transposase